MTSSSWPRPNRYGVFTRDQCEVWELLAKDAAPTTRQQRFVTPSAEILIVQGGPRAWYASAGYSLHSGDMRTFGGNPHAAREDRYPSCEAALRAMAEWLLERMGDVFRESEKERSVPLRFKGAHHRIAQTELQEAEHVARWAARLAGVDVPPAMEQLELFA